MKGGIDFQQRLPPVSEDPGTSTAIG